jgi:hypothetical protein
MANTNGRQFDRQVAQIERCELCGHAFSMHNELGYCRVNKMAGGRGMCTCDGTKKVNG